MRRLFVILAIIISILSFYWFATYGTWKIIGESPEVWGTAFDYLGGSLLHGSANIPAEAIGLEGIRNNGETFMYFGMFPALLRIIGNAINVTLFGLWSRISCFLALTIAYGFCVLIARHALVSNRALSDNARQKWLAAVAFGLGLGSPILFLSSDSMIFIESISWALCFTALAMYGFARYLSADTPGNSALVLSSAAAAGALLSRMTFAIPLYLILGYLLSQRVRRAASPGEKGSSAICAIPALAGIVLQLWYNWARFGSPFISLVYQMVTPNPENYGGEFNFFRIPIALYNFFWIRFDSLSVEAPYFHTVRPTLFSDRLYAEWSERIAPLTLTAPWLVVVLAVAVVYAVRRRISSELVFCLAAFAVQAAMILSWHFITERYAAEFLPLFMFALFCVLYSMPSGPAVWKRAFLPVLIVSIFATPLTTIDFHLMAVGDTGKQKSNRPLLQSIFHQPIGAAIPFKLRSDCGIQEEQGLRGQRLLPNYSLPFDCPARFEESSSVNLPEIVAALTDASHECEGSRARLIIKNSRGGEEYRGPVLSQRGSLLRIKVPVSEGIVVFEKTAGDGCALGVLARIQ